MVGCMHACKVNGYECVRGPPDRKYMMCVCAWSMRSLSQSVTFVCVCGSEEMEFSSKHGLVYSRMKTKHLHISLMQMLHHTTRGEFAYKPVQLI